MIALQNVCVSYGSNVVYQNFDFNFSCGVNVVLGKSGCGKTTLIKVIANLLCYSGSCQRDGDVAVVFQQPCLAPVSVWKNIDAVLPKGNNQQRIDDVLASVNLADKKNSHVCQLSGGEQQRVSLARAFATQRKVLLLDEPFSNLDYGVKVQLRKYFSQLVQNDTTVVFVTHDIDEALALADRIYLLKDRPCTLQEVAQISTPRHCREEFGTDTIQLKKHLQQLLQ